METLPTTEENMRLLQGWKQVSRGWKHHINSYTGPDNHWQRNLRTEIWDLWQSLLAMVQNESIDLVLLGPHAEIAILTNDLCTALKTFSFSRALVGGVALIISTLTWPNDHFRVTLGPNAPMTADFLIHERNALQSLLAAGLLRHGLAPTPWHSSRTGPWDILSGAPDEYYFDILPRLQDYPDPAPSRTEAQRREHDILPILQNPALARTEAQRRGLDILQILQALLDIGNPTENATEHLSLSIHEKWDLQQHHRSLILHLYVLLPILFLTRQQKPYRAKLGRVGRTPLIELLSLRHRRDAARPDPTHAQYFGHLWTGPVPGRKMKASSQAADWADTLSIRIHPSGTLASKIVHRVYQDNTGESPTDLEHQVLIDQDSQRLGLTLLNLLNTAPETNPTQDDAWKGFMLALSFSGDLLTSLTHAITNPLADDLNIVSLQGVESLYRELEVKQWTRDELAMPTMITLLISEVLLSQVWKRHACMAKGIKHKRSCPPINTQPESKHNGCKDTNGA